jgi:hypothetical protein
MIENVVTKTAADYYTSDEFWNDYEDSDSSYKVWIFDSLLKKSCLKLPHFINAAEIGCGQGAFLFPLVNYFNDKEVQFKLQGYDISPKAISLAMSKSKFPEQLLSFHSSSAESIPDGLDFIFCIDVLEHVENPWEILRNLALKSEYLILHLPIEQSIGHLFGHSPTRSNHNFNHIHFYSWETAKLMIQESPFEIVEYLFTPASDIVLSMKANAIVKLLRIFRYFFYKLNPKVASIFCGGSVMMLLRNR